MATERSEYIKQLQSYISKQILDGKDIGLDETTPLLEWGIINSMEIMRLITFIQKQFGVHVPFENITAENFATIATIDTLISEGMMGQKTGQIHRR
jgi:acyl carrier protein